MQKLLPMRRLNPLPRRTRRVHLLCTQMEFEMMTAMWKKSTCRTFSEYGRKALLSQPVVLTSLNLSVDSLIESINASRVEITKLLENPILSTEDKNRLLELVINMKIAFYQIADLC